MAIGQCRDVGRGHRDGPTAIGLHNCRLRHAHQREGEDVAGFHIGGRTGDSDTVGQVRSIERRVDQAAMAEVIDHSRGRPQIHQRDTGPNRPGIRRVELQEIMAVVADLVDPDGVEVAAAAWDALDCSGVSVIDAIWRRQVSAIAGNAEIDDITAIPDQPRDGEAELARRHIVFEHTELTGTEERRAAVERDGRTVGGYDRAQTRVGGLRELRGGCAVSGL